MKLREDKSWEQATSSEQFADMYRQQIKEAPAKKAREEEVPVGGVRIRLGSDEGAGDVVVDGDEGDGEVEVDDEEEDGTVGSTKDDVDEAA